MGAMDAKAKVAIVGAGAAGCARALEVGYFAERRPATVATDPLLSPGLRRMRG